MVDTSCFGECCDCKCYTCDDCIWCYEDSSTGCECNEVFEECCGCAPQCLFLAVGGMTYNDNRHCDDCWKATGGDPDDPCPIAEYGCIPWSDGVCGPLKPTPDPCEPVLLPGGVHCSGQCADNESCDFANGAYILEYSGFGSCFWQDQGEIETAQTFNTNCCREDKRDICECLNDPGGCCCAAPGCSAGAPCPVFESSSCGTYADVDDCLDDFCASPDSPRSPCLCMTPSQLLVTSYFCDWTEFCPASEVMFAEPCTTTWWTVVSFLGCSWYFAYTIDYSISPGVCGDPPYYGFPCNGAPDMIKVPYLYERQCWCDWGTGSVAPTPIACPIPFWNTAKPLIEIKDGAQYINISELKRRKWMKSFKKKLRTMKVKYEEKEVNTSFDTVFKEAIHKEHNRLLKTNPELQHPLLTEIYQKTEKRMLMGKFKRIRKNKEISRIYDICKECPYFQDTTSSCMLANIKLDDRMSLKNDLTNADLSCPDYPPRWTTTDDLEDLKKPEEPPKIL
ncbi:MAG: hypothetical protein DWQ19_11245 [Crenarchaeota archaeon]|nr:MAG: hypothetical protein DWQ19_11245 [Thermoproteota archaeon]